MQGFATMGAGIYLWVGFYTNKKYFAAMGMWGNSHRQNVAVVGVSIYGHACVG